jgi:hypothetical protein
VPFRKLHQTLIKDTKMKYLEIFDKDGKALHIGSVMPLLIAIDELLDKQSELTDLEIGQATKVVRKCEEISKNHAIYPIMYNEA